MSAGEKIPWAAAAEIAQQLVRDLEPVVVRVKTVGSVRRRRPQVGDLELLVEPRRAVGGLFGETVPDIDSVRAVAERWGRVLTRNPQRQLKVAGADGVKIELYLCHPPAQWGSLLAIRTGPAELGQFAVTRMLERGLQHKDGRVIAHDGRVIPTPEEEDFFALAGLPCLPPARRGTQEAFRSVPESRRG